MLCSHLETPTHSPSSLSLSQPLSLHLSLSFSLCVLQNVGNVISCVPVKSLGPWPKTPDLWSDGQVSWFVCVRAPVTLCVISRSICYKAPNMPFPSPKFSLKKRRGYPHFASQRAIVCELRVSASAWCVDAFMRICVCVFCDLSLSGCWTEWHGLVSGCGCQAVPAVWKPAALLGRLNCWGRASTGALSSAKAKWNYTTEWTLQVVYVDSLENYGWIKWKMYRPGW